MRPVKLTLCAFGPFSGVEVIEFNAKTVGSVQEFVKATLSESTERSITRRAIAVLAPLNLNEPVRWRFSHLQIS